MEIRVKEIMNHRGWTIDNLASRLGMDRTSVSMALRRGLSSISNVVRYAEALGVPVWELLHKPEYETNVFEPQQSTWRLSECMQERGINQPQLATMIGVKQPNIHKYCTIKDFSISVPTIEKIAAALEVPVWQLFISEEDYRREMERRKGIGMNGMNNEITKECEPVNECGEDKEGQGKVFPEDLFAGTEEQEWPTLEDGTYRYGGVVIELRNGKINIAIPEK